MGDVAEDLDMRMADGDFATAVRQQQADALCPGAAPPVPRGGRGLYHPGAAVHGQRGRAGQQARRIKDDEAGTRGVPLLLHGYGGRLRNAERGVLHRPRLGGLLPAGQHGRVGPGLRHEQQRQAITAAQSRDFDGLAADRVAAAVLARCKK